MDMRKLFSHATQRKAQFDKFFWLKPTLRMQPAVSLIYSLPENSCRWANHIQILRCVR